jgi:NAD(P)-dependent dehydrogenase (short-subunit alcohol dehydrogenase family)
VVTGSASGIGAATSNALAGRGWRVVGIDLHPSATDLSFEVDVRDREGLSWAVSAAADELGGVDLLVTAAGYYEIIPIDELDEETWLRMLEVILGGTVNTCAAVLPHMVARGHGSIVAISSELALSGSDRDAHYATAKGCVLGFIKSLALEVAEAGVRVNSVAPGPTDTPLLEEGSPWRAADYLATLPLRRLVAPEEVAAAVLFLATEGTYFCGEVISPNGGAVI